MISSIALNKNLSLAGCDREHIYLSDVNVPAHVLIKNWKLETVKEVLIDLNGGVLVGKTTVKVDSPYFFVADSGKPMVYRGLVSDWKARPFLTSQMFFSDYLPLSGNRIVINTEAANRQDSVFRRMLGIIKIDSPHVNLNPRLLKGQLDEHYSTMGRLSYSKEQHKVIFTYLYRNEIVLMDTNLNLLERKYTIDTITKIKVKPIMVNDSTTTLASPPGVVNFQTTSAGGIHFVNSDLMGNEDREKFDRSSVIDFYSLEPFKYRGSFYIPDNGSKLDQFMVNGDRIVATFNGFLVTYSISPTKI
ncbi:hypothetical protein KK062_23950 [Fulvivirgaceae bacterium PWU5]|uniref:Uncharacterized protein n=2 Tax=Dawidia cretensis TaxID=2782350 RepID=A0AAP2E458_9BACT|nr:hypothetical protein [Dawidia cretensis]